MYYEGLKVKFRDIDLETYNMLPPSHYDIVVAVHFAGFPLAYKMNGLVVEDAAHALGAKNVGSCQNSQMVCFSFHPVKTITTGEGGAITTNNYNYYQELKELRSHGQVNVGYNYRIPDVLAALGITQLNKIGRFLNRRKEIFQTYNEAFKGLFKTPVYSDDSACHLYVGWFEARDKMREYLKDNGIGTQIHYQPTYRQRNYGVYQGNCKNAETYSRHALSLPLYPAMTDKDVKYVIEKVKNGTKSIN
jgi:dTDP-4-amino-4,6-dideoxygalactose transaminase